MKKEKRTLENLFRTRAGAAGIDKHVVPDFIVKVQREHTVGAHVIVHPLGVDGDTLDFTVVDNKLIPHFVTPNGNGMSFGEAFNQMQMGDCVARSGWLKGDFIAMQVPDGKSKMTKPYLFAEYEDPTAKGERVQQPFMPSQNELFADDWIIVSSANGCDSKPKSK